MTSVMFIGGLFTINNSGCQNTSGYYFLKEELDYILDLVEAEVMSAAGRSRETLLISSSENKNSFNELRVFSFDPSEHNSDLNDIQAAFNEKLLLISARYPHFSLKYAAVVEEDSLSFLVEGQK